MFNEKTWKIKREIGKIAFVSFFRKKISRLPKTFANNALPCWTELFVLNRNENYFFEPQRTKKKRTIVSLIIFAAFWKKIKIDDRERNCFLNSTNFVVLGKLFAGCDTQFHAFRFQFIIHISRLNNRNNRNKEIRRFGFVSSCRKRTRTSGYVCRLVSSFCWVSASPPSAAIVSDELKLMIWNHHVFSKVSSLWQFLLDEANAQTKEKAFAWPLSSTSISFFHDQWKLFIEFDSLNRRYFKFNEISNLPLILIKQNRKRVIDDRLTDIGRRDFPNQFVRYHSTDSSMFR